MNLNIRAKIYFQKTPDYTWFQPKTKQHHAHHIAGDTRPEILKQTVFI